MSKAKELEKDIALMNECFDYCQHTGRFWWKNRPRHHFNSDVVCKRWNTRYGGSEITYYSTGYKTAEVNMVGLKMHRIAWILSVGPVPEGMQVDHINGDKGDNRISNLRIASPTENIRNAKHLNLGMSLVSGVKWRPHANKWQARIQVDKSEIHLGYFDSKGEAAIVRAKASLRYFGKFSPHYRKSASK